MNPVQRHQSMHICEKPFVIMGIVNVTPDSFYDGGQHASIESAVEHGLKLIGDGADGIDIGGESTRPGAASVPPDEQIRRVVPVVEKLRAQSAAVISVDTTSAEVAKAALDAGADWVNDISAGRFDSGMADLCAQRRCGVVLMHSRKSPRDMQQAPHYVNTVQEVIDELGVQIDKFIASGVSPQNIVVDPGIGFAKRYEDNLQLLKNIGGILAMGYPLLLGTSRKSFIGIATGQSSVENRLAGSLATVADGFARGVTMFRVHDVRETKDVLTMLSVIDRA